MSVKLIHESTLTSIAEAIRSKTSTSALISVTAFPSAISNIESGIDINKLLVSPFSSGEINSQVLSQITSSASIRSGALYQQYNTTIDISPLITSGTFKNHIGEGAFKGVTIVGNSSMQFPINDSCIGVGAFENCKFSGIYSFTANDFYELTERAFKNTNFYSLYINRMSKMKSIGSEAFCRCSSLTAITGDSNFVVSNIRNRAFYNCSNLTNINFDYALSNLQAVGSEAFRGCSNYIIPVNMFNNQASIDNNAFDGCLMSGTYSLNASRFRGRNICQSARTATSSTTIDLRGLTDYRLYSGGYEYCFNSATLSFSGPLRLGYIPEGFFYNAILTNGLGYMSDFNASTKIGKRAFYNTSFTTSVSFINAGESANAVEIEDQAFYNCRNLYKIGADNHGYPFLYYGTCAFYGCVYLKEIDFGQNSVYHQGLPCYIGKSAFGWCVQLSTAKFVNIGIIDTDAFSGCSNLSNFYIYGNQVPVFADPSNAFNAIPSGATIYVPTSMVNLYEAAPGWSSYNISGI